jgi:NTE family protein
VTTAFVLSSGASRGAAQAGMLRALAEHGVRPDVIVGCSIGAINGAAMAQDPTLSGVARIEHLWRTTDARAIVPRGLRPTLALARRSEAVDAGRNVHAFLHRCLTAATFEELPVPFHCVATDVARSDEAWFDRGPLVAAVLASASIPAMFPSVRIDGGRYLDGAVVNDVPVRRAVEAGARTLYVLEVGGLSRAWREPTRPVRSAIEAYWIARRHRYRRELASLPAEVTVHHLPAGDPVPRRFSDFRDSGELIDRAHAAAAAYLAKGTCRE